MRSIMRNPFNIPLNAAVATQSDYPAGVFEEPSEVTLNDVSYPELTGLGGGVASYRGTESTMYPNDNPSYVGHYALGYVIPDNDVPDYQNIAPAPGSSDLIRPRNSGEVTGKQRLLQSIGPVTMSDSQYTGRRARLVPASIGNDGPNVSGADYAQATANAYFASQAVIFSRMAADSAMVAAL